MAAVAGVSSQCQLGCRVRRQASGDINGVITLGLPSRRNALGVSAAVDIGLLFAGR